VTDGLSNTFMFSETAGGTANKLSGTDPPYTSTFCIGTTPIFFSDGFNDFGFSNTFGSNHIGIIHFALADGSVRGFNITPLTIIDQSTELGLSGAFLNLLRLGGIRDGQAVDAN
jgi:hypothetical protein